MNLSYKKWMKSDKWVYGLIGLLCFSLFFNTFWNADEIWNYNFANAALDGLLPYKEINMVSTPLSIYITAIFLKVFGESLFAYRIASYVLFVVTLLLLYKLTKKITNSRVYSFIVMFAMFAINLSVYIYNYNNVALCLVLFVLILEKDVILDDGPVWKNICIGICCGFIPLMKQSIGAMMLLAHGIVCLYYIFVLKRDKRKYLIRILLSAIPGLLFVVWLLSYGIFKDFLEYALLGIGDFTYRISLFDYMALSSINFVIGLLPIGIAIYGLIDMFIFKKGNAMKYVFSLYVWIWLFAASYPMCDEQHFFAGLVPVIPLGFLYIEEKEKHKDFLFYSSLVIGVFMLSLNIIIAPDLKDYPLSRLSHYEGIPMDINTQNEIEAVCDYIQDMEENGQSVYIAYEYAAMYRIPLDTYIKNWDLLLVGNLGTTSVEELLAVEENSIFLVPKEGCALNKMAHVELMEYIRENYEYIDEVQKFDVYKKDKTK